MTLAPFALERYFAAHEFSVQHLLSSSDCETLTVRELLALDGDGALDALMNVEMGYTESTGEPALRQRITEIYETIGPDEVLVHAGAQEAIFAFMSTVLHPGDHVVVHEPAYQSLFSVAEGRGMNVTRWRAEPSLGWGLDLDALEAQLTDETRAIVVNFPHNPTGDLMPRGDFDSLVEMARARGAWLFCDEVYRELEHDPKDRLPAICDLYERGISLGVMSKTYGLAGLRVGWVATHDAEVLAAMAAFKDYLTICNSPITEHLACVALGHRHTLAERNRRIVADNLVLADAFFSKRAAIFEWHRPKAGPVAFVGLREGGAEAFCARAIKEAGVMLLPSTVFGWGDSHIRFGFGRRTFAEALAALDAIL